MDPLWMHYNLTFSRLLKVSHCDFGKLATRSPILLFMKPCLINDSLQNIIL